MPAGISQLEHLQETIIGSYRKQVSYAHEADRMHFLSLLHTKMEMGNIMCMMLVPVLYLSLPSPVQPAWYNTKH